MQNEPWWVVQVQGAPQQVRAMETELTFGVLLGEGKRVGKERETREKGSTQSILIWEREREVQRAREKEGCKEAESHGKR